MSDTQDNTPDAQEGLPSPSADPPVGPTPQAGPEDPQNPQEEQTATPAPAQEETFGEGYLTYTRTEVDPLVNWLISKVAQLDNFGLQMVTDQHRKDCIEYLVQEDRTKLFCWTATVGGEYRLFVSFAHPQKEEASQEKLMFLYFLKTSDKTGKLTPLNIDEEVMDSFLPLDDNMKSLMSYMSNYVIPNFLREKNWPSNIKKDFLDNSHKFLNSVQEEINRREGDTKLYIPQENFDDPDLTAAERKDMGHRLEAMLITWNSKIKELLNVQMDQNEGGNVGPIDEIHQWRRRKENLMNIKEQIDQPKLQKILSILKENDSSYLNNFLEISKQIEAGALEAEDNLRYLSILEEPCTKMAEGTPLEIPELLPTLLHCVRVISECSTHYKSEERIAGLLRRISNEIIRRCREYINLDDMFNGNVEKCIQDLNDSMSCGIRWQEIFPQHRAVVNARSSNPWNFKTDSIFAQIDAFNQRCLDLIEICTGQIQFARKGREYDLPLFSGTKGPEIVAVLDEIRDTFKSYLNNIRGSNQDKILDIKSTKWHDDYNVFKNGMKNLDNGYINLINFAFESVNTVPTAVEYLEAFFDLSKRSKIRNHVKKQIEKVNELFSSELRIADQSAKRPFSLVFTHGELSGHAIWIKSLLVRIEDLRRCYDRLVFIENEEKQPLRLEYNTTEKNLHKVIKENSAKYLRFVETTDEKKKLADRESERIFTLCRPGKKMPANVDENKNVLKNSSKTDYIESNFDKDLLKIIIEGSTFKKLSKDISNNNQAVDAYIFQKRDTLRIYRENVMLAIRKYNMIQQSMSSREKALFEHHLRELELKKVKGLEGMRWKSTIESFVQIFNDLCDTVYGILQEFKTSEANIGKKCQELAKLNFIVFDTKDPYELEKFKKKQLKNREEIGRRLTAIFSDVRGILKRTYQHFIDQDDQIHLEWFEYIRDKDAQVENELLKAYRFSFNNFYKAINGDENTDLNPVQLFKTYIVILENDKEKLGFDPDKGVIKTDVTMLVSESINLTLRIERLETEMLEVRRVGVQEHLKAKEEENNFPGGIQPVRENFSPSNDFILEQRGDLPLESFKEKVSTYTADILTNIEKSLETQLSDFKKKLNPWQNKQIRDVWSKAKDDYFKETLKELDAEHFQEQIDFYDNVQNDIRMDRQAQDTICVYIDTSKIRESIQGLVIEAQKRQLDQIKALATSNLDSLYALFEDSARELEPQPEDLHHLKRVLDRWAELNDSKTSIQKKIPPLERVFKLLDTNQVQMTREENKRRAELNEKFEEFCQMLDKIQKRNKQTEDTMHAQHDSRLDEFNKEVQEKKDNDFDLKAPFSISKSDQKWTTESALKQLDAYKERTDEFREKEDSMQFGFDLFSMNYMAPPQLDQMETKIEELKMVWTKKQFWDLRFQELKQILFDDIVWDDVVEECDQQVQELRSWKTHIQEWGVAQYLLGTYNLLKANMPIVELLRQPSIRDRHWQQVKEFVGDPTLKHSGPTFILGQLVDHSFHNHLDRIEVLVEESLQQYKIETELEEIKSRWNNEPLVLIDFQGHQQNIKIIKVKAAEKINEKLEEDLIKLTTMKNNIHAEQFVSEIEIWERDLNKVLGTIEIVMDVQRKMIYFSSILDNIGSDAIQIQHEVDEYRNVENLFAIQLERVEKKNNVKASLTVENITDKFEGMNETLDGIQRHLRTFLREKRCTFARFFFLSDEDMFELLGKVQEPKVVNNHLKKMFEGIKSLNYIVETNRNDKNVRANRFKSMVSTDGEEVPFPKTIEVKTDSADIISLMKGVEEQMKASLKKALQESWTKARGPSMKSLKNGGTSFNNWISDVPGQIQIITIQAEWTAFCRDAIRMVQTAAEKKDKDKDSKEKGKKGRKDYWKAAKDRIDEYVSELPKLIKNLDKGYIKKRIMALIIIQVYQRELIDALAEKVHSSVDFEWTKHLRYEIIEASPKDQIERVIIEQGNAAFNHGWEYQGNNGRLVITPLTDRCYLTLTNAMHLKRGGAPQGPAGTGKTETVKDLGKNMGIFVFVFNCSEGLEVKSLKSMFEGFSTTGSWGCFDEFNRIEIDVLSVVAIQINAILDALSLIPKDQEEGEVLLDDDKIVLKRTCSIFITMNPGYAGRTELPDNLKALFRPISMMAPDLQKICEITLKAQGFLQSTELAEKIETLYDLMKQQLSQQDHYSFGLRSIKAVLMLAGKFKNMETAKKPKQEKADLGLAAGSADESRLLIRAIRDMTDPILVRDDIGLFKGLLSDLFPSQKMATVKDRDLTRSVHLTFFDQYLENTNYAISKVVQLHNSMITRHGNMMVGLSMSGKSTTIHSLAQSINKLHESGPRDSHGEPAFPAVQTFVLNPKAIEMTELYGYYNPDSETSEIGVFSDLMDQHCNKDTTGGEKWIIFDGPIDTKWIESMNSLLDDNKVLTLLDGNRINLHPSVKLLFEVQDLKQASPATVSRCGMVYMDIDNLDWDCIRLKWILKKEKEENYDADSLDILEEFFDKWVEKIIDCKRRKLINYVIPITENALVQSMCNLLDAVAIPANQIDYKKKNDVFWGRFEKWFIFSVIWALGGGLDADSRKVFDSVMRDIEGHFPLSQTVFDCYINVDKSEFVKWEDRLTKTPQAWQPKDSNTPEHRFLVETVDTMRTRQMIDICVRGNIKLLLLGKTGTGKTAMANSKLKDLDEGNEYSYNTINLSANTSSPKLQEIIESRLDTTVKKVFRPKGGKNAIIFVDDLNMPKLDEYGSQPPLELLRQLVEYGGWYNRKELNIFVKIHKTSLLCAMGPPGGGRNPISGRLTSKFQIMNLQMPQEGQIKRIFASVLHYKMLKFDSDEIRANIDKVTEVIIDFFNDVLNEPSLKPTPVKSHYMFNMRDMSRVVQGITLVDKDSCDSLKVFLKLVAHENFCVYRDRMINSEDRRTMRGILDRLYGKHFMTGLSSILDETDEEDKSSDLLFVNFLSSTNTIYSEVTDLRALKEKLDSNQENMNSTGNASPMDTVFFHDAMLNCCKINRILNLSNGHALLIGEGGSGRHSLTKMASFLVGYKIFQVQITKNFNSAQFNASIKDLFEKIMHSNKPMVFLFSEEEITSENIIEDVNNILSLGEIPNLYRRREGKDEFQNIKRILEKQIESDKRVSDEKLYDTFVGNIQKHLHVVFCIGQSGPSLRNYGRQYPGLINNTTQIWFNDWPESALIKVARKYLEGTITVRLDDEEDDEAEGGLEEASELKDSFDESESDDQEEDQEELERVRREKMATLLEEKTQNLAEFFGRVHSQVSDVALQMREEIGRVVHITPKNFIDFVKEYIRRMEATREYIQGRVTKYEVSLKKLTSTQEMVEQLRKVMNEKNIQLSKQNQELNDVRNQIKNKQKKIEMETRKQNEANDIVQKERDKTEELIKKADKHREQLQPTLDEAIARVDELSKNTADFAEVKTYAAKGKPEVLTVLRPIMVLLNESPSDANIAKVITKNFLPRIKRASASEELEKVNKAKRKKFNKQMKALGTDVGKASKALEEMRKFVSAISKFLMALEDIEPTLEQIKMLEAKIKGMAEELSKGEEKISELTGENDLLLASQQQKDQEIKKAQGLLKVFKDDLEVATSLVSNLKSSQENWTTKLEINKKELKKVEGDVMMTVAFLNYSGPFNSNYRKLIDASIRKFAEASTLAHSPDWDFVKHLGTEKDVLDWTFAGLPSDQFSKENGIIVMKSKKWSLMIDPQSQANRWLKKLYNIEDGGITAVSPTTPDLMGSIKTALEMGLVVIFQDIPGEFDPSMVPLLDMNIRSRGAKKYIMFGDSQFPYNDDFRLFMTTRMANPTYTPAISTKVALVNFSVKQDGLEEQLLEKLIKIMKPKLEETRVECIEKQSENTQKILELEEEIIQRLNNSTTEIHKDRELDATLQRCKETEENAKQVITNAVSTLTKNEKSREDYRPLGRISSLLYFTISDLSHIDHMYQFSLDSYVQLFEQVIRETQDERGNYSGEAVAEKIEKIDGVLRKKIFDFACQGIFEKDKLLLSLMMAVVLAPIDQKKKQAKEAEEKEKGGGRRRRRKKKTTEEGDEGAELEKDYYQHYFKKEWNFFLKGGVVLKRENQAAKPGAADWITSAMWDNITELEAKKLPSFAGIEGSFIHSTKEWNKYYTYENPESEPLPSDWGTKITGFSLLVLLRAIRPDRITFAAREFVKKSLGGEFVQPPTFDMMEIYQKTRCEQPLLFILSPGSNPWTYLEGLTKRLDDVSIVQVSLGQGQAERAKKKITNSRKEGQWVYLANIHLSPEFLKYLESLIETLTPENTSPRFRLFLSADPSPRFPVSILQNSLKVTTEPPKGIKKNMLKIYNNLVPDSFAEDEGVNDLKKYLNLLFALSWFHSLVIERKKFRTMGWNVQYDFNDSDFLFSEKLVRGIVRSCESQKNLQWDAIRYIISEVNYGGRVTDDWDRRLLNEYSDELFQEALLNQESLFGLSTLRPEYKVPKCPLGDQSSSRSKSQDFIKNPNQMIQLKKHYISEIEKFDDLEVPAVFGNHGNAEISSQKAEADQLLLSILKMQPTEKSESGDSRESVVLRSLEGLQERVPDLFNLEEVRERNSKLNKDNNPLNVVLVQEIQRFNVLLKVVKQSFVELTDALNGKTLVSEAMEEMTQNFYDNKVPKVWKFAYHSVKPLSSWITDLEKRINFFNKWAFEGVPTSYWLGGFTYPTGFTTALKQKTARDKKVSIHKLKWEFTFTESGQTPPQGLIDGAYISGVYLEGARYHNSAIEDEIPMCLHYQLPIFLMKPVKQLGRPPKKVQFYDAPVYAYPVRTGVRENPSFLFTIRIQMSKEHTESFFIKRGTACLLSLADQSI